MIRKQIVIPKSPKRVLATLRRVPRFAMVLIISMSLVLGVGFVQPQAVATGNGTRAINEALDSQEALGSPNALQDALAVADPAANETIGSAQTPQQTTQNPITSSPIAKHVSTAKKAKKCVTINQITFLSVAQTIARDLIKSVPKQHQKKLTRNADTLFKAIGRARVAGLLISTPSSTLNEVANDLDNRPSNYLAGQLMKAKRGAFFQPIRSITLNEAIETSMLLLFWADQAVSTVVDMWPEMITFTPWNLPGGLISTIGAAVVSIPVVWGLLGSFISNVIFGIPNRIPIINGKFINLKNFTITPIKIVWKIFYTLVNKTQGLLEKQCFNGVEPGKPIDFKTNDDKASKANPKVVQDMLNTIGIAGPQCKSYAHHTLSDAVGHTMYSVRKIIPAKSRKAFDHRHKMVQSYLKHTKVPTALLPVGSEKIGGLIALIDNPALTKAFAMASSPFDGRLTKGTPIGQLKFEHAMEEAILVHYLVMKVLGFIVDIPGSIINSLIFMAIDMIPYASIVTTGAGLYEINVIPSVSPLIELPGNIILPLIKALSNTLCPLPALNDPDYVSPKNKGKRNPRSRKAPSNNKKSSNQRKRSSIPGLPALPKSLQLPALLPQPQAR